MGVMRVDLHCDKYIIRISLNIHVFNSNVVTALVASVYEETISIKQ